MKDELYAGFVAQKSGTGDAIMMDLADSENKGSPIQNSRRTY